MLAYICQRLLAFLAAFCVVGNAAVLAGDRWDHTVDETWRSYPFAGYVPTFQSGDTLPKEGVFGLTLQPVRSIVCFVRSADQTGIGYGGIVTFESLPAGRYAIVLSQDALVEAVQQRPFLPIAVTLQDNDANALSKREIGFEGGPLTLQLTGVFTPSIMVEVLWLPD
jgi:hypothetical protein